MLIGAFGLFWERDAVDWCPGRGRAWQMLGRRGEYRPGLRVVDFRRARGVYVLFNHHGAYYVGLGNGTSGLGGRLKDHTMDEHAHYWTRFCWFSFDAVSHRRGPEGFTLLRFRDKPIPARGRDVIGDMEALLIEVLGTQNINRMRFRSADEWLQVRPEEERYLARLT